MSHQDNLTHVCRLCGQKSVTLKEFKWYRNKSVFYALIEGNDDNEKVCPQHDTYCEICTRDLLIPLNKSCRKTKIEEVVENIKKKQFSFELHTSECKVCIQFLKPSEDGDGAAKSDLEFHMKALKRICAVCGVQVLGELRIIFCIS